MHSIRCSLAACVIVVSALAARGGEPDYAALLRSHESRMALLQQGVRSLLPLLQIAVGADRGLAEEAQRMLRWLAVRACGSPTDRAALTQALLGTADKEKGLAVRKLAVATLAVCGRDDALPLLLALARTPELAAEACDALAQLPGGGATKAIVAALGNAKGDTRALLAKALAARRDPAAVGVVATLLEDEALRESAFESLERTPGVAASKELAEAIDGAEPAFRVRLLRALGERRSAEGLGAALKYAGEAYKAERAVAIEALGRLGDRSALTVLLETSKSADPAVKAAALTGCRRLADSLLATHPAEAAKLLAHVVPLVGEDERIAALGGLARTKQASAVPAIAPLLVGGSPDVGLAAAQALAAIPGPEAVDAMRGALKDAAPPVRTLLLRALGERKAEAALADIVAMAADADESVQVAAMDALAAIASPEAAPAIRAALEKGTPAVQSAAALAYLPLGKAIEATEPANALAIYHRILAAKVAPGPLIGALEGVARLARAESAAHVQPLLEGKRDVRNAAAAAYLAIASTVAATGDRKDAAAMLAAILALKPAPPCAAEAAAKLRAIGGKVEIPAKDGLVTQWWLIGAWTADIADWPKPRFPEKEVDLLKVYAIGDRKVRWIPGHSEEADGSMTLDGLLTPNEGCVAYAYAEIQVDQAQDVSLEIASDDGCQLWLNGAKVYEFLENRGWGSPPDTAKAKLSAGLNKLLLKVCEGSGTWAFRLRIKDAQGKPLAFKMR